MQWDLKSHENSYTSFHCCYRIRGLRHHLRSRRLDPSLWKEAVAFNVFDRIVVGGIILVNELNGSSSMWRKFALLNFFDGSEKAVWGVVGFIDTYLCFLELETRVILSDGRYIRWENRYGHSKFSYTGGMFSELILTSYRILGEKLTDLEKHCDNSLH
jgi:hypothetical protein